jgi:hypothetical protein
MMMMTKMRTLKIRIDAMECSGLLQLSRAGEGQKERELDREIPHDFQGS